MVSGIFTAKVQFSYLSKVKIRPILILKENRFGDYIFMPLSSNIHNAGIILNNNDLIEWYLPKTSVVIIEKIETIHKELIIKRIGILTESKFDSIISEFCKMLTDRDIL